MPRLTNCRPAASLARQVYAVSASWPPPVRTSAIRSLRGNVGTRLSKLDNGEYDAIILAAAGLKRLQLEARIRQPLSPEQSLPAVGQGAVGIECRLDDAWTRGC